MRTILTVAAGALALSALAASAEEHGGMFIEQDMAQPPEEAATALREHAETEDDWLFLAEFGLAGGAATAVKICYLPIGADLVAAGLHTMAMMPCGNFAFYEEDGQSRMSMLDPAFMTTLAPDADLENAVETASLAFEAMLEEVYGD